MKVTLKNIQRGIAPLNKLAQIEFPASFIKLAWKIKRISEPAIKHFEQSREYLNKLVQEYGTAQLDANGNPTGAYQVTADKLEAFNKIAEDFLSPEVELWGDPLTLDELEKAGAELRAAGKGDLLNLSATDLMLLDWLIVDGSEAQPLTLGASAD